jgi:hypothetical protein
VLHQLDEDAQVLDLVVAKENSNEIFASAQISLARCM